MNLIKNATVTVFLLLLVAPMANAQECTKGDVNLDGQVNLADIVPFQDILQNGSYQCEADGNYDGVCDLLDASPFLNIMLGFQDADFSDATVDGPGDFFWSRAPLGFNASNETLFTNMFVGDTETLYLYYSINGSAGEVNAGAALNVAASNKGVIQFTQARSLNYQIVVNDQFPFDTRWHNESNQSDGPFQNAAEVTTDLIIGLTASNLLGEWGLTDGAIDNDPFLDLGYDPGAGSGAFLFGSIEFNAVAGGDVTLIAGPNDLGVAHNYDLIDVTVAAANIHVILPGDVNLDGAVNLLDVQPFVNLLSSGNYSAEADCNYDGTFNLLDVSPFIDKLQGN